jgi:hypothetical protein
MMMMMIEKLVNDENSHFYIPQYSNELKKIGRHINQIECGGEITFFLFGNYNPLSLKEICTNIINEDPFNIRYFFKSEFKIFLTVVEIKAQVNPIIILTLDPNFEFYN